MVNKPSSSIRGALRNSTGMIQQDSQSGYLAKRNVYRKTHTRNHSIGGYSEMMTAIRVHMDPKANNNEPEKTTELTMNVTESPFRPRAHSRNHSIGVCSPTMAPAVSSGSELINAKEMSCCYL